MEILTFLILGMASFTFLKQNKVPLYFSTTPGDDSTGMVPINKLVVKTYNVKKNFFTFSVDKSH